MRRLSAVLSLLLVVTLCAPASADYEAGVKALQNGQLAEAITEFQGLIKQLSLVQAEDDPQYAPYYLMLGQAFYKSGKFKEAEAPLQKTLELKSGDLNAQLLLGQAYYRQKNYRDTAGTLAAIDLSKLPASSQASISRMLAASYDQIGQSGLALRNWEKTAKLAPSDPVAQFNYGKAALTSGYVDDAVKALEKAVSLDGKDPAKRKSLGNALVLKSRQTTNRAQKQALYQKASSHASVLVSADPSFDNLMLLASAQLGAKQFEALLGTADRAIAKNRDDWLPPFYKGQALTSLGRFQDAIPPLDIAVSKRPPTESEQRQVFTQLGFVHNKLGHSTEAQAAYRKAGNNAEADRIADNERIAKDNKGIEAHNAEVQELEKAKRELEEKMKALPGGVAPPPSR